MARQESSGERSKGQSTVLFGPFRLSPAERRLSKHSMPVELGGRAFDILLALVDRAGEVVSKNELIDIVWPDTMVEEGSLRFHVASLRKALGDGEAGARFVTTVYGGGYCFVAPVERADPPPPETRNDVSTHVPHRLPLYPSRIVGRDGVLREAEAQLKAERFVTVVGPGGIGKTMLAVAVGRALLENFSGQVVFFDLSPVQDPHLVPGIVATTFGLIQTDDPITGLIAYLRNRKTLLILDSCEHVIEQVALLAERLFQDGGQTYILATSREALRVHGEHLRILPPLECPTSTADLTAQQIMSFPATELLVERVIAGGYDLDLDRTQRPLIAEICRSLDGIPLAIELAAGSIVVFGLQETAARLNSRIELLWQGKRTAPARHQTLGAVLDWSYQLLSDSEQVMLRRLSVFAGHFSLEAAQSVADGAEISDDQGVTVLASLVAKSLVAVNGGEQTAYRLLDTTRTYARNKLTDSGEAEPVSLRHARYFLELLEAAAAGPPSPHDGKLFSSFGMHLGNIRAALDWSFRKSDRIELALQLAAASGRLFIELSLLTECRNWAERAIAVLDETTRASPLEMELQAAFGFAAMHLEGNSKRSEEALKRSLMLAQKLGHPLYQLRLLSRLHLFHSRLGKFYTALEYAKLCEPVAREIADPMAIAEAHTVMGAARLFEGDCTESRRHLEAALVELPVSSQVDAYHFGAFDFRARVRIALAQALWLQGFPAQALEMAERTMEKVRAFNHPVTVCIVAVLAARVLLWARKLDLAERHVDQMIEMANRHSLIPYQAVARAFKGELMVRRGDAASGVAQLRAALDALHAVRYELQTTCFMMVYAEGLAMTGQNDAAMKAADETAEMIERGGDFYVLPDVLRIKGSILAVARAASPAAAGECYRRALDLAAGQRALAWELRAAMSLAGLQSDGGDRANARAVLAAAYGRFTEGFDHPDLLAAQEMLRSLN
jgi:predicted ATPase/DNA-binding winged helix-turn-helix (wHTH) protein